MGDNRNMKYIVAIVGGFVVFVGTFLIAGLFIGFLAPDLTQIPIHFGPINGSLGGLITALVASLAATGSLKVSLSGKSKTGRWYRKKRQKTLTTKGTNAGKK